MAGDPRSGWASGTALCASCDAHPVGSNTATNPAATAAAFRVLLLFAFTIVPFCGCATRYCIPASSDAIATARHHREPFLIIGRQISPTRCGPAASRCPVRRRACSPGEADTENGVWRPPTAATPSEKLPAPTRVVDYALSKRSNLFGAALTRLRLPSCIWVSS